MTASVPHEPWSVEAGLTDDEWAEFVRLRDRMRAETVECPWCKGSGRFLGAYDAMACRACGETGLTDRWTALAAPRDEDLAEWDDSPAVELPVELAALRDRLLGMSVRCPACNGSRRGRRGHCRTCGGTGAMDALSAALYVEVRCPHCSGSGVGGGMLSWECGYCGVTGRIDIGRFAPYGSVVVGETHGLWPDIVTAIAEMGPDEYDRWRDEFNPCAEAVPGVNWAGVDFSSDDFSGLDLSKANLSRCIFGDVANANFSEAKLDRSVMRRINARNADFTGADLSEADLSDADLSGSTIDRAFSLDGADLTGTVGLTPEQIAACRAKGAFFDDDEDYETD